MKSKVITGVGASSGSLDNSPTGKSLAAAVELAMSQAVTDAMADGIDVNDGEKVRPLMLAARERVKAEYAARVAEAMTEPAAKN